MYKYLIIAVLSLMMLSCKKDKKTQLDNLRKQHDQISEQIKLLEKDIQKENPNQKTEKREVNVSVKEVVPAEFSHFLEVQGKLDGDENVGVTAQSIGVIRSILVKEGDIVRKGQVMAIIDDAVLQQTLKEMQSQLEFVNTLYEKQKSLWEQKIGSEVQYLSAKNNKEAIENRIATLKDQMDMYKIKSPIEGSVEEVGIKIGQAVSPGFAFFRVVNFSKIKVVADVSENYSAHIKKGDLVSLYFPDIDHEVSANIDFTSKYINPVNRTFLAQVRFTPDNFEYRANMITVVRIRNYHSLNALVVPVNIIQSDPNGKYIYVAEKENDKMVARKRIVKTGEESGGLMEIVEGLKPNDKVVTTGFQNLEDGVLLKL